ncbi:MAG: amidohydrolase [Gammaproteobacteria bacterium]|nr:amidohydrolase [Gammaproteobacteria bacterium]
MENSQDERVPTIDCQVHAYERDRPERPWAAVLHGPAEVTGDDMVAAMDSVGVDGALLVSPWTMYRFDPSYALEVYAKHSARFGLIKPFNPKSESVSEEIAEWASTPGVVGARIMASYGGAFDPDDPGFHRILAAGAKHGLPINILGFGQLPTIGELARRNPNTQLVVDHVGLKQPFEPPAPDDAFADLDEVLALAQCDNVAIKISGACTLAHTPFPYPDIWAPLRRIFDAFGFERCMWGTDWTRAVGLLTYEQGVEAFRVTDTLSASERQMLMGGSLMRIYNWAPS